MNRMTAVWTMPENRCVKRNEARTNLALIIENLIRTKECVWIGSSIDTALSSLITVEEYNRDKESVFPDGISEGDVEIEELRKNWSRYRSIVEGSGKSRRVLKRGTFVAVLVPTALAYDRHINEIRDSVSSDIRDQIILEIRNDELLKLIKKTMNKISEVHEELIDLQKETRSLHVAFKELKESFPEQGDVAQLNDLLNKIKTVIVPWWRREQGLPPIPIS